MCIKNDYKEAKILYFLNNSLAIKSVEKVIFCRVGHSIGHRYNTKPVGVGCRVNFCLLVIYFFFSLLLHNYGAYMYAIVLP